ncbi:MAG: hypothetical protein ACI32Z_03115, partial [Clostridium sp.]
WNHGYKHSSHLFGMDVFLFIKQKKGKKVMTEIYINIKDNILKEKFVKRKEVKNNSYHYLR